MRKYTLKRDYHDHRDFILETAKKPLPSKVDLRPKLSPIVDQGQLGSCTANAIASGLREYIELKDKKPLTRLSRLFLYWHERDIEGTVNEDSGAYIRDGMKVLKKIGVCPEPDFPYDISKFTERPSQQAETDAAPYKIKSYHRVLDLHGLKYALAHGMPVIFGFMVYDSFESEHVAETGIIPFPDKKKEQLLGGHAVLAAGYDDEKQVVIVRNSWGEGWGDKGYCYMPYKMFEDRSIVTDLWTGA